MKIKTNITNLRIKWHTIRKNYLELLLDSCLNAMIQTKLKQKITYHNNRIFDLV
ncbi:hypothetical protein SAMN05443253_11442 [Bacillus sp. OK048]|nr:hypothetical protein SAMN05443253_11442 [Bacillus sp. OK048]